MAEGPPKYKKYLQKELIDHSLYVYGEIAFFAVTRSLVGTGPSCLAQ